MVAIDTDRKVLLREGDWTIETRMFTDLSLTRSSRWATLLKHACYLKGRHTVYQVLVYPDDSSCCWRCTKKIPEGMVAVWKFQNWEQLQYGG